MARRFTRPRWLSADRLRPAPAADPSTRLAGRPRTRSDHPEPPPVRVAIDQHSAWRTGWVLVGVLALAWFGYFVITDGAPLLYPLVMAFFASIALEPAVSRLSRWMPRVAATAVTLVSVIVGFIGFMALFGGLLRDQLVQLVSSAPAIATSVVNWVNQTFHTSFDTQTLLARAQLDGNRAGELASSVAGGLLGVVTSLLSAALTLFVLLFLTFYLSADAERLRVWIASMFPPRHQVVVLTAWELTLTKIGGYVGARLVLALICGGSTAAFLFLIGMPYWLPLGIWTGVIAQFVPTVGTYLGILLPVLVGLGSDSPVKGLYVLAFAIAYQQIENLTFEPRISARAVRVHPAVSFSATILGASLFGAAGALVGVPVSAALIALFDIYKQRWELSDVAEAKAVAAAAQASNPEDHPDQDTIAEDQPDAAVLDVQVPDAEPVASPLGRSLEADTDAGTETDAQADADAEAQAELVQRAGSGTAMVTDPAARTSDPR